MYKLIVIYILIIFIFIGVVIWLLVRNHTEYIDNNSIIKTGDKTRKLNN